MRLAMLLLVVAGCPKDPEWLGAAVPMADALPEVVHAAVLQAAQDHRLVGLGEPDHYIADKYAYRLAMLRALVLDGGVRQVAMEIGGSDAARIDAYLASGEPALLDRVVLYGYRGDTPEEQRELAHWPAVRPESCEPRFIAAERAFWTEVYGLSVQAVALDGRRVELFGFDFDAMPGGGFEDARARLRTCEGDPWVDRIGPTPGTGGADEVARLRALASEIAADAELDTTCPDPVAALVASDLEQLADSYETAMAWGAAGDELAALREVFVVREGRMVARMQGLLGDSNDAVVLLGHNLHLSPASTGLRFGPEGSDLPMWASVVTQLGEPAWTMWLLVGEGTRLAQTPSGCDAPVVLREGSLEAVLDVGGDHFWLPVHQMPDDVLDTPWSFGAPSAYASGPLRDSVQAIVYRREVRASE